MKKLLGTTAIGLALAVTPALADDPVLTDVTQILNAPQGSPFSMDVLGDITAVDQGDPNNANRLLTPDDDFDDISQTVNVTGQFQGNLNEILLGDEDDGQQALTDVTQDAVNRANIAVVDDIFSDTEGSVFQGVVQPESNQVAKNFIGGGSTLSSQSDDPFDVEASLVNVDQTAANVANSFTGDDLKNGNSEFTQFLADSVDQTARNTAWFELSVGGENLEGADQVAANDANSATVNGSDVLIEQITGNQSDQVATNKLLREDADDDGTGSVFDSSQLAQNLANTLNASGEGGIVDVSQYGGDSQTSTNELSFGDRLGDFTGDDAFDVEQVANNAMNVASVSEFGTSNIDADNDGRLLEQYAAAADPNPASIQYASNVAFFEGSGNEDGNVEDFRQSASNSVNLASVDVMPSLNGITEFRQQSLLPQTVSNSLTTIGSVNGVSQVGGNTANEIGNPN
jgi:hypothetical protein